MNGVYQTLKYDCKRILKGNILLRNFFYNPKTNPFLSLFSSLDTCVILSQI
jgi:hypothetical protein